MFSVIIPTRDRLELLQRAVESVTDQTQPPEALIVINDGSTDGTADWLNCVSFPGLVTVSTGGVGVSAARNRGIELVSTPWTVFLDDDDVPSPTWLERLGGLAGVDVGIVSCAAVVESPRGRIVDKPSGRPYRPGHALFLAGTWGARTQLLRSIDGFMAGLTWAENTEISIRLVDACEAAALRIAHTDEPLVTIHQREVRSSKRVRHEALLRVVDQHDRAFTRERRARWLSIAGVDAFRHGDVTAARHAFARAFRSKPSARTAARLGLAVVPALGRRAWSRESR